MMKRTSFCAVFAVALCVPMLHAQADVDPSENRTHVDPASGHQRTGLANPPANGIAEADIVGFMRAVDQSEIDASQMALDKSKNEDVRAFAREMIDDHQKANRELDEVGIEPADSSLSNRLKERSKMTSTRLSHLEGSAFDRAYMSAMVDDHTMVLDKLDKRMIPSAKTGTLATNLREQRPIIESHLDHARRVKTALGTK